jgi:hypothetical protein
MEMYATSSPAGVRFRQIATAAVAIAVFTALLNNLYGFAYSAITGVSVPHMVNFTSITAASVLPALAAGLYYLLLTAFNSYRADMIYWITVIILGLLSLSGPLSGTLPDGSTRPEGFTLLTLPMHLISGIFILCLPQVARRF